MNWIRTLLATAVSIGAAATSAELPRRVYQHREESRLANPAVNRGESSEGLKVIHRFPTVPTTVYPTHGLVQASDGALYGTTYNAGGKYNYGSVFRVTADSFKTVHSFDGADGYGIGGPLTQASDGYLYGVTDRGGKYAAGSAYRLSLDGEEFEVIYSFGKGGGAGSARTPQTRLIEGTDGALYGTTLLGGNARSQGDFGAIFRLTRDGDFSVLHYFRDGDGDAPKKREGRYPSAGLALASDGNFYGCTSQGGPKGGGTVFRLAADGAFTTLHAFDGIPGNTYCWGDLLVDGEDIFGTTYWGGESDGGTVFRLSLSGAGFQVLHSFEMDTDDGNSPMGGLTKGPDGSLYGTTYTGGSRYNNGGTVFRCTLAGELAVKYSFGTDDQGRVRGGYLANGGLIMANDGYLYGTTYSTVFRLPP